MRRFGAEFLEHEKSLGEATAKYFFVVCGVAFWLRLMHTKTMLWILLSLRVDCEPWHQSTRLSRPFVAWRALCPRLCCCTTIQPCLIGRFPFLKTSQRYCTKVTGLPRSHQAHESLRCCAAVLHINPALHGLVYHQVNC